MTTKTKWFLAALALSFPLDQITKYAILAHFYYGERLVVIPGVFDLTYVRNPGGAFSFFATGAYEWRMLFFVGSTVVSVILLLVFLSRHEPESRLSPMALGLIMGGSPGQSVGSTDPWRGDRFSRYSPLEWIYLADFQYCG